MPIGEVSAGLSILKVALASVEKLRELAKKRKDGEIISAITEIQTQFLDLQSEYSRLLTEHEDLKGRHRSLEESIRAKREDFDWRSNVYWKRAGGEGPFCPSCLDGSLKQVRMSVHQATGLWLCPVCKHQEDDAGTGPLRAAMTRGGSGHGPDYS